MAYDLISIDNALKIKDILLTAQLLKPIEIIHDEIDLHFFADSLSEVAKNAIFENMDATFFMNNDNSKVLKLDNRNHYLFFNIGDWGGKVRIPNVHICLGTPKFGEYFSQLELSQALEDNKYIYIVKNISKLGGKGSIKRLYNGLHNNKSKQRQRLDALIRESCGQVIYYNEEEWLSVTKISKEDLTSEEKHDQIAHNFLTEFLNFAFLIEKFVIIKPEQIS